MSVNPRFERVVIAEMARRERRVRRSSPPQSAAARAFAQRLHAGHHDLLGHLWRVARALPDGFRRVAWLHHAGSDCLKTDELVAAGLTVAEINAVELLVSPHPLCDAVPLDRARAIASTPGTARAVAPSSLVPLWPTASATQVCGPAPTPPCGSSTALLRATRLSGWGCRLGSRGRPVTSGAQSLTACGARFAGVRVRRRDVGPSAAARAAQVGHDHERRTEHDHIQDRNRCASMGRVNDGNAT